MTTKFRPFSPGTKRYQRYPRTGEHKRAGGISMAPNRPINFQSWLVAPLHIAAGRFRRLAREFVKKATRAERMLRAVQPQQAAVDAAVEAEFEGRSA